MSKAKIAGRGRRARDDLTAIHHIGEKSEQALNKAGIHTRRELLAADRGLVLSVLRSTQHLSPEAVDEVLREAARLEMDSGSDGAGFGQDEAASVHVFEVELSVAAGTVVSTSTRHVVGGAPSTWPGFDLGKLRDFVGAAIGLTTDLWNGEDDVAGALSPADTRAPSDRVAHPHVVGVVRASEDVRTEAAEELVVHLRRDGDLPDPIGPGMPLRATIYARSREREAERLEIGSLSGTVEQLANDRLMAVGTIPSGAWYGIEVVVEVATATADDAGRCGAEWIAVELEPGTLSLSPSPPPLELARRRFRSAAQAS